jgi:hypothetical protein
VISLYPEAGWETVTALVLPETTDSLFLRLRPSHGLSGSYSSSWRTRSALGCGSA